MLWGVVCFSLAVALLFILVYPFRVRVTYEKTGEDDHPLTAALQLFGRFYLSFPLHLPEESKVSGMGSPTGSQGQESPGSPDQSDASAPSSSQGGPEDASTSQQTEESSEHEQLSLARLATYFVKSLFLDTGGRKKGHAPKSPMRKRGSVASPILRSIHVFDKLEWETRLGTDDAALTALAVGAAWTVKGVVYTSLARRVRFVTPPHFAVRPQWNGAGIEMRLDCIFRLRLGEIILAWVGDTLHARKKGARSSGQREGSSH